MPKFTDTPALDAMHDDVMNSQDLNQLRAEIARLRRKDEANDQYIASMERHAKVMVDAVKVRDQTIEIMMRSNEFAKRLYTWQCMEDCDVDG